MVSSYCTACDNSQAASHYISAGFLYVPGVLVPGTGTRIFFPITLQSRKAYGTWYPLVWHPQNPLFDRSVKAF